MVGSLEMSEAKIKEWAIMVAHSSASVSVCDDEVCVRGKSGVVCVVLYKDFCDVVEGRISRNSCHPFVVVIDVVFLSFVVVGEGDVVVCHNRVVCKVRPLWTYL